MVLMIGQAISQTSPIRDSSLIANKDLRKAALLIEQGKVIASELKLTKRRVELLEQSNDNKDSIITSQDKSLLIKEKMLINYAAINEANKKIITIQNKAMEDLRKSLRCQKRRTWLASIIAIAAAVILVTK